MNTTLYIFDSKKDLIKFRDVLKDYLNSLNCIEYSDAHMIYASVGKQMIFHINNAMLLRYIRVQRIDSVVCVNATIDDATKENLMKQHNKHYEFETVVLDFEVESQIRDFFVI